MNSGNPQATTRSSLIRDIAGRLAIVAGYGWQASAIIQDWIATGRVSNLLFLITSGLIVWFAAVRRQATTLDPTIGGRIVALLGTFAPLGFRPGGVQSLPDHIVSAVMILGSAIVLSSVWFLGRNFGIIPAHRGVSERGPYKLVRHPLYASYFLMHAAFVAANTSAWNIGLWIAAEAAQMWRTVFEERVLRTDPRYVAYQQRVRWRMIPFVF